MRTPGTVLIVRDDGSWYREAMEDTSRPSYNFVTTRQLGVLPTPGAQLDAIPTYYVTYHRVVVRQGKGIARPDIIAYVAEGQETRAVVIVDVLVNERQQW